MLKGSIEARPPSHSGFNWDEHESYPQTTLSPNIEALQLELALTLGLRLRLEMGSRLFKWECGPSSTYVVVQCRGIEVVIKAEVAPLIL